MENFIKSLIKYLQKILTGLSTSKRSRAEGKTAPSGDNAEEKDPYTKPFLEHLEDLRVTILWCAIFLFVGIIIAIPLAPAIMKILKFPIVKIGLNPDEFLKIIKVTAGFSLATRVVFWSGLLFSLPFMVLAIGGFIFPGLKPNERRAVLSGGGIAILMFVIGVVMGYCMLPLGIKFLLQFNKVIGIECSWVEWSDYISFVIGLLIGFGLAFELPVLLYVLGILGIINSEQLRKKRSIAVVTIMICAAIITPTTDMFSMLAMSLPLWLLYELCIWGIRIKEKSRAAVDGGQMTDDR